MVLSTLELRYWIQVIKWRPFWNSIWRLPKCAIKGKVLMNNTFFVLNMYHLSKLYYVKACYNVPLAYLFKRSAHAHIWKLKMVLYPELISIANSTFMPNFMLVEKQVTLIRLCRSTIGTNVVWLRYLDIQYKLLQMAAILKSNMANTRLSLYMHQYIHMPL